MRVVLSTIGSRGDVQPLVALAVHLKRLGQEVRLPELHKLTAASPPPATPSPPSPERLRQMVEQTVASQFETIAQAADGCDVRVGATALQIAARSLAEKMGIPYHFVAYCPAVLPSPHHAAPLPPMPGQPPAPETTDNAELWARDTKRFNDTFGPALNSHRASQGLPPIDAVRRHIFTDRPWLAADPTLAPWPDPADEGVFQTGAWILPDDRPLSRELKAFLDAGDPPIYFGFGSIRAPEDFSQVVIQTARRLGRRAIVSRGWTDLPLIDSEPDCLAVGETNLQSLFTRVAAIVHHGGAGTTTTATFAGTPQVVIPQVYDQHYFARRVQELGIGFAHERGAPTIESLTRVLAQALEPEVAARARSIAPEVRTDGVKLAAQQLMGAEVKKAG